jgi:hypothetical protein
VILVGERAPKFLKARRHPQDETLQAFYTRLGGFLPQEEV